MTLTKLQIKPLGNKVLLKRSQPATSKGGILLPESAQQKPRHGEVLAIGPGKIDDSGTHIPMSITVGQKVLYAAYAGTEVPSSDGEELLLISEDDILAIMN